MERRRFLAGALGAVGAGAILLTGAPTASAVDTRAWMGGHGDGTPLQRLTIPGTHDSGARFGGPWSECQNTTIAQQLDSGIRFLDVRCRVTGGSFAIHHGASYQNMMFGDVLVACRDFLAAHPSETVLMRVKQEYSTDSDATFRAVFDDYLDARGWRSLFRIGDGVPLLGEARGRVVLIADNGGLPGGLRWGDGSALAIQDDWNALPDPKYAKIEAHFRTAVAQPGRLYVNFVSTSAYLPPRWNSDNLNPRVHRYLDSAAAAGAKGLGIVPMDFPNTRSGLVEALLRHN
ncbi:MULTISPECIES: phosphatidylinositol-specific phospholipase C [Streptomyces]|uniref:phosphatidylinositol-specific phospholipase C n=1 Tax=Streptomyces TaxID=1883 RepID=UPI0005A148E4|nr:phosphatidylinositol-specific phospholipase C [Streptomyces venezuelae]APE22935.1 phospholipase [Streptomyces venezuelae]QES00315.1 phosphatidylinositol-specific phospholipase C domain-containing protein [Streptomyces venezuelae ATCC 10712]QES07391.1 phosphatidylinositol-specific phospholipase C domain-containing protein [Streptomyces venezuelae]